MRASADVGGPVKGGPPGHPSAAGPALGLGSRRTARSDRSAAAVAPAHKAGRRRRTANAVRNPDTTAPLAAAPTVAVHGSSPAGTHRRPRPKALPRHDDV